jgi:uncharacterized protein YggE
MRRTLLIAAAAAALLAVAAFAGVGQPQAAHGDTAPTNAVTTVGHGVVTAVPDEATVSAGVRTDATTATEALSKNADLMTKVIAALKNAGADKLQTQQVSLYPQTDQQGKVTGYTAQNSVSAHTKIANAGALVDAAVAAGANTVDGPTLDVADTTALYRQALAKALDDARGKAQALAQAGGFGIGPVLSVTEQSAQQPIAFASSSPSGKAAGGTPTPVEPGTQDVTADVQVAFTIR